jgi:sigma-E factor negative regulatory protein RseC
MNTISMDKLIEHSGIIDKIENNRIHVLINNQAGCSECQANGVCLTFDSDKKIIEMENSDSIYKPGDQVILFLEKSTGPQSVFLAFVFPFVLILFTLLILKSFVVNELISGAISIAVLIPYYCILSFFSEKLKTKFKFNIKKVSED